MIKLTRFNGKEYWLSSEQIEFIESTPDTVISLVSGKKVLSKETPDEIVARISAYKRQCFWHPEQVVEKPGKETPDDPE